MPAITTWPQPPGALDSGSAHEIPEEEAAEAEHAPRHGGSFGDADDLYHYEVLLEAPHRLVLYVNDERNEPLNVRALQGRWTLNPDDASLTQGPFHPSADGAYFFADLPPTTTSPLHVAVAVLKDGEWATMEFFLPSR